jgi:DNA-binding LacI/PurR family transcriptional regulator
VPNLQDVARRAGVSVSTASRVLSGGKGVERISEDCVRRVRAAARAIGYRANYHARSLQTGRAEAIGILLRHSDAAGPLAGYMTAVLSSVDASARAAGYHCVTIGPSADHNEVQNGLRYLEEGRIDGLIVPEDVGRDEDLTSLEQSRRPVVLLDTWRETQLPVVATDAAVGIRAAVAHLAELGHRRLLWVGLRVDCHHAAGERRDAFHAAAGAAGLQGDEVLLAPPSSRAEDLAAEVALAHDEVMAFAASARLPTGVVCFHDIVALGVYAAANELRLRVPADLSVVGFDDILAVTAYPAMTTVSHMLRETAQLAVRHILEMAGDADAWAALRGIRDLVPARLVVRASTAPPGR